MGRPKFAFVAIHMSPGQLARSSSLARTIPGALLVTLIGSSDQASASPSSSADASEFAAALGEPFALSPMLADKIIPWKIYGTASPNESGFACVSTRTNALVVALPQGISSINSGNSSRSQYEVGVSYGGGEPFMTVTTHSSQVELEGLRPNGTYTLSWRYRRCINLRGAGPAGGGGPACHWVAAGKSDPTIDCRTRSLATMQPLVLPPTGSANGAVELDAITVRVHLLEGGGWARVLGHTDAQLTLQLSGASNAQASHDFKYTLSSLSDVSGDELSLRIEGLQEGQAYAVRAAISCASKLFAWSDSVTHHTRPAHVEPMRVYRISEHLGSEVLGPDYLTNHDAAGACPRNTLALFSANGWPCVLLSLRSPDVAQSGVALTAQIAAGLLVCPYR